MAETWESKHGGISHDPVVFLVNSGQQVLVFPAANQYAASYRNRARTDGSITELSNAGYLAFDGGTQAWADLAAAN